MKGAETSCWGRFSQLLQEWHPVSIQAEASDCGYPSHEMQEVMLAGEDRQSLADSLAPTARRRRWRTMGRQGDPTPLGHHTGLLLEGNATVRDPRSYPGSGDEPTLVYGIVHSSASASVAIWHTASLLQAESVAAQVCSEIAVQRHQQSKERVSPSRS